MLKIITEGLKAAPIMNSHIEYDYESADGKVTIFDKINISMPTILPNGVMMTINLHDFHNKNIDEMTDYIKDVRRRAENSNIDEVLFSISYHRTLDYIKQGRIIQSIKRIRVARHSKNKMRMLKGKEREEYYAIPECDRLNDADIEQGTVTISNLGSLCKGKEGCVALLEVIPPQVTVVGIGAIQEKPIIKEIDGKKEIVIGQVLPICLALDHRAIDFGDVVPFIERLDEILIIPKLSVNG